MATIVVPFRRGAGKQRLAPNPVPAVPAAVAALVVTVRVDESAGFGAKAAVAPAGNPPTESVTGSVKLPVLVTVTEYPALPPWTTLCDVGAAAREKSGGAAAIRLATSERIVGSVV